MSFVPTQVLHCGHWRYGSVLWEWYPQKTDLRGHLLCQAAETDDIRGQTEVVRMLRKQSTIQNSIHTPLQTNNNFTSGEYSWRFRLWSSGLWRHIVLQAPTVSPPRGPQSKNKHLKTYILRDWLMIISPHGQNCRNRLSRTPLFFCYFAMFHQSSQNKMSRFLPGSYLPEFDQTSR